MDKKLKTGKLGETIVGAYKKVEDKFVETFLEEDGSLKTGGMAKKATDAYQKVEDAVVGGYKKVENSFVETFLEDDKKEGAGETSEVGSTDQSDEHAEDRGTSQHGSKVEQAVVGGYKKIEDKFVETFLNEDGSLKTGGMAKKATDAYQKIEDSVVGSYKKIEDRFVETFLEDDKKESGTEADTEQQQ